MANKWMKKLGLGMSVIMTVSQLGTGVVLAAPEEDTIDEEWGTIEDKTDDFEEFSDEFIDILEDKFDNEQDYEADEENV